ncbi:MAG: copper amine oxidase N-terminal domain-containing protein [Clostridiales bacterium]|jgi:hypothetical protein|nr:copper amine oxidase N-terminal domain-containing protein [Clostridiales bacterium]
MIKLLKGAIIGASIAIGLNSAALAKSRWDNIDVRFDNIKIYVDGMLKHSEDEPFIYNDRTYAPLRFISEALGKNVEWDADGKSIRIETTEENQGDSAAIQLRTYSRIGSDDDDYARISIYYLGNDWISVFGSAGYGQNVGGFEGVAAMEGGQAVYHSNDSDLTITFPQNGGVHVEEEKLGAFGGLNVTFNGEYEVTN